MNPAPNLAGRLRLGYIAGGAAIIHWGFFYADPGSGRLLECLVGAALLIEGLIGYCPACALLGLGSKKPGENPQR